MILCDKKHIKNLTADLNSREGVVNVSFCYKSISVIDLCIKINDHSGIGVDIVIVLCHADKEFYIDLLHTVVKVLMRMDVGNICFCKACMLKGDIHSLILCNTACRCSGVCCISGCRFSCVYITS